MLEFFQADCSFFLWIDAEWRFMTDSRRVSLRIQHWFQLQWTLMSAASSAVTSSVMNWKCMEIVSDIHKIEMASHTVTKAYELNSFHLSIECRYPFNIISNTWILWIRPSTNSITTIFNVLPTYCLNDMTVLNLLFNIWFNMFAFQFTTCDDVCDFVRRIYFPNCFEICLLYNKPSQNVWFVCKEKGADSLFFVVFFRFWCVTHCFFGFKHSHSGSKGIHFSCPSRCVIWLGKFSLKQLLIIFSIAFLWGKVDVINIESQESRKENL